MSETTQIVADAARTRNMQLRGNFRRSAQGREIVVVLGMHRSGTSLLANILHLLGVDMLDQPTYASTKNETGFWERQDILAVQDEILATLGVPVGSPAHAVPFASGWWRSVEIRPLKEKLRDLVGDHLKNVRRPWGFKDPRTCRLLPLWGEILEELDVSPRFVWAVRHPAESSRSMTEKNPLRRPIPVAQSEVMWLAYNYDILRYAGRHWPLVVPYEAWFGDALAVAKDLAQELDLVWQGSDHELEMALAELINPDQRHHWAAGGGGKLRCSLALSEEVYRSILSLRNVSEANVSETLALSLQSLLGAVQPFALEARESRTLKEETQRLAADMKSVQSQMDEAAAQIASHQERAERQRENEAILVARVDTLTRKMNEARAERDALQAEMARLAAEAERMAALDTAAVPLAAATAAQEELERQLAGARAEAQRLEGERDALQAELAKAASLAEGQMRQLEDQQARQGDIAARLAQAGEERDGLRKELHAAIAAREMATKDFGEVSARLEGFRKQLAAALSGREGFEQKLAAAQGERDKIRQDLASAIAQRDALERKLSAAAESRSALERELAETVAERQSMVEQLATVAAERDGHRNELALMSRSREASERDLASLNTKLDGFRSKLAHAIETRAELQGELAAMKAERDRLAADLAEAAAARDVHRDDLAALAAVREAIERDFAAANQKLDGFRKQIAAGTEAREQLEAKLADHAAERERQAGELSAAAQRAAELQAERDRQAGELTAAEQVISELQAERDRQADELAAAAELAAELQADRDRQGDALELGSQSPENLEESLRATMAERVPLVQALADLRGRLRQAADDAGHEKQRLADALAEAQSGIESLQEKYSALASAHDSMAAELDAARHAARQGLEAAVRDQDRLAQALDTAGRERDELAAQVSRSDVESGSQRILISRLQADVDRLKSELITTKNALRNERERMAELAASAAKG